MEKTHVNCLYWNIHGISSKTLGEKTKDKKFLEIISAFDIIGISELHTKNTLSIPGFYLKKQKFRPKKHKGPKIGGGIAVFIKQNIAKNFQLIPSNNVDSIWIKTTFSQNNYHIGFYYCSPEKAGSEFDFQNIVNSEIEKNNNGQNTIIFGDFNARTKTVYENIAHDKSDDYLGVDNKLKSLPLPRNSEDMKIVNKRGKEFLDICRINDLTIANGRTTGDLFGKYTCHQKRGSSVVDYLLTPCRNLSNILNFKVGEHLPLLSDHCPITATIRMNSNLGIDSGEISMETLPDSYIWKDDSTQAFQDTLSQEEFKLKVDNLMNKENLHVDDIKELLQGAAKDSDIKMTNNKRKLKKQDPPWFDDECRTLKNEINRNGKILRSSPDNIETRENIYVLKKKLRNTIRKNKMKHSTSIVNEMCGDLSNGEHKKYWRLLRKLEGDRDEQKYIPDIILVNHFKELLQAEDATPADNQAANNTGRLDFPVTEEELKIATKILKAGKGTGIDTLRNEMLRPLVELYPQLILKSFNDIIIQEKDLCKDWLHSLITAIHKKGAKDDPGNYRGISLMSCLGKLFLTVINNRLIKHCLENGLLSPAQLGFVAGNRTSDPHIILHNLIQKYCHKKNQKMFGCFVDFSKAFDTVPRDILLKKLKEKGIDGRVLEIIKALYLHDTASVKIGKSFSPPFVTNIGVRQGCVLSPLLFNLFLADLQPILHECDDNAKIDDAVDISCLLWADDILMFSKSEEGLQRKLDKLEKYCTNNKLTVNTDKTQCMVFNKTGRLLKNHKFTYKNTLLTCVREYKYLGFIVTPSGGIRTGLEDLRIRAMKAFAKMRKALGIHFRFNLSNTLHIFTYLIRPILLYCSDFWGCLKQPKNHPIEKFFMMFCKQILGVRKQTNTDGILVELGLVPITFHAKKLAIRNWERIQRNKGNTLLLASHKYAVLKNLPWAATIRDTFARNGLEETYLATINNTTDGRRSPSNILVKRLIDQFHQTSMESINNSSKMKVLSLLKETPGAEKYLSEVRNTDHRMAMSKLRLSGHTLEIERGRYNNTQAEERYCTYCKALGSTLVEDEKHFLLHCPMSKELREKCLPIEILNDNVLSDNEKFINIMTNSVLIQSTAKFVYEAFKNRDLCLEVLNTINDVTECVEDICLKTQHEDSVIMPYKIQSQSGLKLILSRVDLAS